MSTPIDFYFDFSSPYGYFASTRIDQLAAEFGRTVNWHPILLGPMFKIMGVPPLIEVPIKGDYSRHDFDRTAALFDIPYNHPARFPISTLLAARAMLWIQQNLGAAQSRQFAHAAYRAYFAQQQDIDKLDTVLQLAEKAQVEPARLAEGIQQDDIKASLKTSIDAAIARGVFGSPFVFVDNEPFWGYDRFDYIRKWLRRPARVRAD
ncbi:2-hydroxychromene-2-carboxylate isomerase [Paralcaligenes sp. KSB-10]|jgi:2-hydroxychromene-2-carboxylate isomerase|uniref:2-hydroxychromene-2-carboxylate isomerase n=1 Tax=Paralcaligenes sp. KSB-10 TaxID=2901142 RepID=UPI001E458095|nr:2-hydroxychromene-2-carboxylate isomerase [Paralcaligenes sp. KSB-10]UHL65464.1 2-hydroxychromene-2-carboxylate isomerase [Paralcaligenes sp. KSB-10]